MKHAPCEIQSARTLGKIEVRRRLASAHMDRCPGGRRQFDIERSARLRVGDPRFRTSHDVHPPEFGVVQQRSLFPFGIDLRLQRKRDKQVGRRLNVLGTRESRWIHPHHRNQGLIHIDRLAKNGGRTAKIALPYSFTDDRNGSGAGSIVCRIESPPQLRVCSHGSVKIPRNHRSDKVGTFDTELVREWFNAFAMNAGVTLHVETLYGENSHHIAESCFKGLARALRTAVAIDPRAAGEVPSTKGQLGG